MGEKKTGPEMLAETLRDIAVLVAVFYTLDSYMGDRPVSVPITIAVLLGCILALVLGIVLERVRKRDNPDA
jgi:hypothetical protein